MLIFQTDSLINNYDDMIMSEICVTDEAIEPVWMK